MKNPPNPTERSIAALIAHARGQHPRWDWNLMMRPEAAALIELDQGLVWHPEPQYEPLEVLKFQECEISAVDLVADFVLASAVDEHGLSPAELVPSYWVDLHTGRVEVWTETSLREATGN